MTSDPFKCLWFFSTKSWVFMFWGFTELLFFCYFEELVKRWLQDFVTALHWNCLSLNWFLSWIFPFCILFSMFGWNPTCLPFTSWPWNGSKQLAYTIRGEISFKWKDLIGMSKNINEGQKLKTSYLISS